MKHGYIIQIKTDDGPTAIIAGEPFVPNGDMKAWPTAFVDNAYLNQKTGFYELKYSTACMICAAEIAGGAELTDRIEMACNGTFPIGFTMNIPRQAITVYSVDNVTGEYTITEFFRLGGHWVHSYQIQGCNMASAFMYSLSNS